MNKMMNKINTTNVVNKHNRNNAKQRREIKKYGNTEQDTIEKETEMLAFQWTCYSCAHKEQH